MARSSDAQTFRGVLMQAILGGSERRDPLFELTDRARLPLAGGAPLTHDVRALTRELREAILGGLEVILLLAPQLQRHGEPVQL